MSRRPDIPAELERAVKMEAGHRCAIPQCQQVPVEIAHIEPWARVKEHKFDNLIALCPTCHTRFGSGMIDRKAMFQYKANLSILNGRYCDLERRILAHFGERPNTTSIELPAGFQIVVLHLIKDGLLHGTKMYTGSMLQGKPLMEDYFITEKGRDFIQKWLNAEIVD